MVYQKVLNNVHNTFPAQFFPIIQFFFKALTFISCRICGPPYFPSFIFVSLSLGNFSFRYKNPLSSPGVTFRKFLLSGRALCARVVKESHQGPQKDFGCNALCSFTGSFGSVKSFMKNSICLASWLAQPNSSLS